MLLIPQIFLRRGQAVALERTVSPIFDSDPLAMARNIKDAGGEAVYLIDLNIANVGEGENFQIIKSIRDELGLTIYVGDNFKSVAALETCLSLNPKLVVLETVAYQEPKLVEDACARFPDKIAVKIMVRAGRVIIPGWAVSPNKTAYDYAEQFGEKGVKSFFYADVDESGVLGQANLDNIFNFCKKNRRDIICTSEIRNASDIEKLMTLGAPGLNGLILAHSLYEGRIDLRASLDLIYDLAVGPSNEPTIME